MSAANHLPEKPLLLFLHGFPDTKSVWREYLELAEPHYECWAMALPGTDPQDQTPKNLQSFILSVLSRIQDNGAKKVYLIGHDLGGPLAVILAEHLKTKLQGLVLIAGLSIGQFRRRLSNPKQLRKSWYMAVMQSKTLTSFLVKHLSRPLLKLPELAQQENFHPDPAGLESHWLYRDLFKEGRVSGNLKIKIAAPTLVLWGRHDAYLLPPTQPEFEESFANFQIRIFNGGHWFHLSNPSLYFQLIQEFFSGGGP